MTITNDTDPTKSASLLERYYRLRRFLGIDLTELEDAFMTTPQIVQDAAELAARADKAHAFAKHSYDIAKAEAGERIRAIPVNGKDPSEARITATVPLEEDVQSARQAMDEAKYEADVCTGLYKSLQEQVYLLNKAADMVLGGFITTTSINERRRAEINEARRATNNQGNAIVRPA